MRYRVSTKALKSKGAPTITRTLTPRQVNFIKKGGTFRFMVNKVIVALKLEARDTVDVEINELAARLKKLRQAKRAKSNGHTKKLIRATRKK